MMLTLRPDDHIGKSLTAFIRDVGNQFQVSALNQKLDIITLLHRYNNEGLGFVTKTLPALGKHFDSALKSGQFTTTSLFKRRNGSVLPCFLQGLTKKVFSNNGTLLHNPDCHAIRLVRQVCFMFYKLEGDYGQELVDECIDNFVDVDQNLVECDKITPDMAACINYASDFVTHIFRNFDPGDISPRPGPGQCSTKVPHACRFEPQVWYRKLHNAYPYYNYFYHNTDHLLARVRNYRQLQRKTRSVSRLTTVPKDSRGPRIICMEPPEFMWLQQGLARKLMKTLERHPLTRGHVNFHDQTINGNFALQSSLDGKYATLDMKEASDRISKNLVELLFDGVPRLRDALLALSTDDIELPDGRIIEKLKYAPMGSALCFPVMSIVHYVLGLAAMKVANPRDNNHELRKRLYVYGDDLIVDTKHAGYLIDTFPIYGLKFNVDKSCLSGSFRESCGIDAFHGEDITPQRVKTYAISKSSASAIQTHLAMFHGFFQRGLWKLASVWRERLEATCGLFPCVTANSPALGWQVPRNHVHEANMPNWKWNQNLQSEFIRARVVIARPQMNMIGGWEQFLRSQLLVKEGSSSAIYLRGHEKLSWSRIPLSCV